MTYGPKARWIFGLSALLFIFCHICFDELVYDLEDFTPKRAQFEYMQQLPDDALIAAHPLTSDFIPFFSGKSVYASHFWKEFSWSFRHFSFDFDAEVDRRMDRILAVLYSPSLSDVARFIQSEGITHFIIEDYYYSAEYLRIPPTWEERYKSRIISKIKHPAGRNTFFLMETALAEGKLLGQGTYILDCEKILRQARLAVRDVD